MDIIELMSKVDLGLLKEQSHLVEGLIGEYEDHMKEAITQEVYDDFEHDRDLAKGLLEFLDNVIVSLESL